MAEAAAAIGLIASIAQLVDISVKIVSRIRDFANNASEVPKAFRSLADRLPLLTQTLQRIKSRAQDGFVADDAAAELEVLVKGILEQVAFIQQCLDRVLPAAGASRFDRALSGLRSLDKDDKVNQAVEKIHHGIDVLVLHQTTSAVEVSDRILQEIRGLSLQSSPPPYVPAHKVFGLCLGRAPQIGLDAFIGRQAELKQLHDWLPPTQNAQAQRIVSIVGMGGLGKTQLSLAYAREYGPQYSSVFWLSAKNRMSLQQGMLNLASMIFPDDKLASIDAEEENVQVEKVRQWLSEPWNADWLIIFDNYDDPALPNIRSMTGFDLRDFFPTRTHGSILITTRSPKLTFSKMLRLQKLSDMDICVAVLSQRSERDMTSDLDARRLAVRLDGLPLALAAAGTYLGQSGMSCKEYLDLYETTWNELHSPDAEELMEYEDRTLSSTWTISFDLVRSQDADAAELLHFLGYFNNDDIWYELLGAGASLGPSWLERVTTNKIRFTRAMSKLQDYSLVEAKEGTYRIHPCLHDWIVEHLDCASDEFLFTTAITCMVKSIPDDEGTPYYEMIRRLQKHINSIRHQYFTKMWDARISESAIIDANLEFGILCRQQQDFDTSEQMLTQALAGSEQLLGPDDPTTLNILDSLGLLYQERGEHNEAEMIWARALAGCEKSLEPNDRLTLRIRHRLGTAYSRRGNLKQAESTLLRALDDHMEVLGPDSSHTISVTMNLGLNYIRQEKYSEAETAYAKALSMYESRQGPDSADVFDAANGLGLAYLYQGKLAEAEKLFTRALTGYTKLWGPDHTRALLVRCNLADIKRRQGEMEQAEAMYISAIAGYEKTLGPDRIPTLEAINDLGVLYLKEDKLAQAEALYLRMLDGYTRILGPDHASTIDLPLRNLAVVYFLQKKFDQAEPLLKRIFSSPSTSELPGWGSSMIQTYTWALVELIWSTTVATETHKYLGDLLQLAQRYGADEPYVIRLLCRVLMFIKDGQNAALAYQGFPNISRGACCDGCEVAVTDENGWYMDRQCTDTDLCRECMSKYASNTLPTLTCSGHEFLDVDALLSECHVPPDTKMDMESWIARLKEQYALPREN